MGEDRTRVSVEEQLTPEEAALLMTHHLQLAAGCFECTADDRGRYANEVIRARMGDPAGQAASAFVEVLDTWYRGLDDEDEDEGPPTVRVDLTLEESGALCHLLMANLVDQGNSTASNVVTPQVLEAVKGRMTALYEKLSDANDQLMKRKK